MTTAAIILAGGSGSRVRRGVNKVYLPIRDRPLLAYSLETFGRVGAIGQVVLVVRPEDRESAEQILAQAHLSHPTRVVEGGPTRHRSEMAGLEAMAADIEVGDVDLVAIHDGARPFVTLRLLEDAIRVAGERGGAIPGLPVEAPLYRIDGPRAEPLSQDTLRRVQTPQVFRARPLLDAYRRSMEAGVEGVDTAETVERFSDVEVEVIEGDERNIKVTFVEDFLRAEEWAGEWSRGEWVEPGCRQEPTEGSR